VNWMQLPSLPEDTLYFHARYHQEFPVKPFSPYTIFEGQGEGHYVGTVLSSQNSFGVWFGGIYIDERHFFAQFAVDPAEYMNTYPEYGIDPPDARDALKRERTACIVGQKLAQKYGFKVGDQITLTGTIFAGRYDFTIRGIATSNTPDLDTNFMLLSWELVNERLGRFNQVGWYVLQITDPSRAGEIAQMVDATFANTSAETKTETEQAFQLGFITMLGNIKLVILFVGTAIVIAIMLVSMNTMMMAARERIREIAVLKALGFDDRAVLGIVLAESLMISLTGGILGTGLASVIFDATDFTAGGFFPNFAVTAGTILRALAIATTLGVLSGTIPAWNAVRLKVVDALRHTG